MLDLTAIKARASKRQADQPRRDEPVQMVANLANRLTADTTADKPQISQLARLASNDDPDRWCWPASDAMTGAELARFRKRAAVLCQHGAEPAAAEALAGQLLTRDRQGEDRHVCLECVNLATGGRCLAAAAGRLAGAGRHHEPVLFVLHRCECFKGRA